MCTRLQDELVNRVCVCVYLGVYVWSCSVNSCLSVCMCEYVLSCKSTSY